jgi:hypothetical protein
MMTRLPSGKMAESEMGTRRATRILLRWLTLSVTPSVLLGPDLVTPSEMLFQSSDRKVLLERPTGDYQAGGEHDRAHDEVNVHIPFGVDSRFVNEEDSTQK